MTKSFKKREFSFPTFDKSAAAPLKSSWLKVECAACLQHIEHQQIRHICLLVHSLMQDFFFKRPRCITEQERVATLDCRKYKADTCRQNASVQYCPDVEGDGKGSAGAHHIVVHHILNATDITAVKHSIVAYLKRGYKEILSKKSI